MSNTLTTKPETINSLKVAEMTGKRHDHLMRDIENYIADIKEMSTADKQKDTPNLGARPVNPCDFFIESTYETSQGKKSKCYEVTKKGCEFIANKMTGTKGNQFTATYVTIFNDMKEKQELDNFKLDMTISKAPQEDKLLKAKASYNNSLARLYKENVNRAKTLLWIAKNTSNDTMKQICGAQAGNILSDGNPFALPKSIEQERPNHELGYFCKLIGQKPTWATELGKRIKKEGLEKTSDNGIMRESMSHAGKQVPVFYWFDDVIIPKLKTMGFAIA